VHQNGTCHHALLCDVLDTYSGTSLVWILHPASCMVDIV
jgi:hypothetical protein